MIRDFARHVVSLSAESGGVPIPVEKLDKQTWRCAPCTGSLLIAWEVFAWELSVRGAYLDTHQGFFNGTSVFPRLHDRDRQPCRVEILPPEESVVGDWRVATAMHPLSVDARGFGTYGCEDYRELIDHPVLMGTFSQGEFVARGVSHQVVIAGRHRTDMPRLCADLQRICAHHRGLFGGPAPTSRYVFLVTAVGEGYGGLEHRSSTALMCSRDDLPRVGESGVGKGYRRFLGLCSHEYFHTWNVKRIQPAAFQDCDLSREVHTPLLWAFEGITSYYDDLALARCGLIPPEEYLDLLAETITRVLRNPGRHRQSVAESSFDAWTKFYRQEENAPNAIVSYYAKGALVALALDLTLRRDSHGRVSLDSVMQRLWERFGQTGQGVAEQDIQRLAEELVGESLADFFASAVYGTGDLPLQELLAGVGVDMQVHPPRCRDDPGGRRAPATDGGPRSSLGARYRSLEGGVRLDHVLDGGAALEAGLAPGDLLVAVDGLRVTTVEQLDALLASCTPGTSWTVHAFRRDELMALSVRPRAPLADTCTLSLKPEPAPGFKNAREFWLAGDPAS